MKGIIPHTFRRLVVFALAASVVNARADDLKLPEGEGALGNLAFVEDNVIVPVPSEIFNVLAKLDHGRHEWRAQIIAPTMKPPKSRTQTALYLGTVVAEGFLAVQAEDVNAVRDAGRTVLNLAQSLGLREAVLRHTSTIENAADKGDWKRVRREFDATRQTVRDLMAERDDEDLAHCVSIGGWLRGTEIVTAMMLPRYSEDRGEILYQPAILDHFSKEMKGMSRSVRGSRDMKTISKSFARLRNLMAKDKRFPIKDIQSIHEICEELRVKTIQPS